MAVATRVVRDRAQIAEMVEAQRQNDEEQGLPVTRIGEAKKRLPIARVFTKPGVHPYDQVEWEERDVLQKNWKTGDTVFEQAGVEFPKEWSVNASTIVTTKYFRGNVGEPGRETSLKQVIDRVVDTYVEAARVNGYIRPDDLEIFEHELKYMILHQIFSFNSPVWFNVGTFRPQQVSACFILAVEDTMDSILSWYREEGLIFKGGSGAGLNLSRLRSSKELLSSGGTASGPISFMRGADASAGTIKSGGATRRAAKMVVLDVDHPDIEEFVELKAKEENKIRVLRDAGYDMDLGGKDISSVQYQNANNSIRVTDEFMEAVEKGESFDLKSRTTGDVIDTVDAARLFQKIAVAAWECADPGIQYDTTINRWHTNPETGRITASNPCSEYMSLDNSSCNLASLNLMKFRRDDDTFDTELFVKATELVITAMEISISFADFPTQAITSTTKRFRQLGIGYANLGALLMSYGLAYDSPEGRGLAAAITSLLTAVSYRRSAELAGVVGPYEGFAANAQAHINVMNLHAQASRELGTQKDEQGNLLNTITELAYPVLEAANDEWASGNAFGAGNGWRNAQASVLAPTGTIGFMMDCDTTGVEPDFSLVKFKKLVGGGSMQIVNQTIPMALRRLGYSEDDIKGISDHITEHGHVIGAPGLAKEHYSIFDCAMGERAISWMGHVRMLAATQPFISGSISKTINLPESATVEDIKQAYWDGWKLGLKAMAVYRDNCKVGQPLSSGSSAKSSGATPGAAAVAGPSRSKLPQKRVGYTQSFSIVGAKGYLTTGQFPDGSVGEIFLKMSKQGSTLAGVTDAFAVAISIGLQYGVPLEAYVMKFVNMRFDPAGMTSDPDIKMPLSIMDYVFRRLALDYLPFEVRSELGIYTTEERLRQEETGSYLPTSVSLSDSEVGLGDVTDGVPVVTTVPASPTVVHSTAELMENLTGQASDAPLCMTCGIKMQRAGACYVCESCGSTSGCS